MSVVQEKSSNDKENEVYFNFINSIRSEVTEEIYGYNIKVFMKSCNVESFYDLFTMSNPQAQIIKHLTLLREKGLSSNSISTRLKMQFKPAKIYCDGSNPNFIKSLKSIFNEAQDYDKVIERARKSKIEYYKWMYVVPVNFNEYGRELLERLQQFVSRGSFALSPVEHKELVQQMRTAKLKENGNLDKDDTGGATYDTLDSARLAVFPSIQERKDRKWK